MGDVLRIEARRSLLLRLSPLIALAHVAIMLSQVSSWRGVWPQASAAVLSPLIFTAPALAGLTALEVSRRSTRWAAPRPPWAAPLLGVQVVAAGVVVACGCVAAVVVNLAAGAPQGLLWPGYVVLALCVAAEAVACGHLLGRVPGPLWFAPVTSVMLVFLRIVLTLPGSDLPPAGRLTRVILSGPPETSIAVSGVLGALGETVLVLGAALAVPWLVGWLAARRSGSTYPLSPAGRRGAVLTAAAALVLALPTVLPGTVMTTDRVPTTTVCTQTRIDVCVWPEQAVYLPELTALAQRADAVGQVYGLTGTSRLTASGIPGGIRTVIAGEGSWFVASSLAGELASSLITDPACVPSDEADPVAAERFWGAYFQLRALLLLELQQQEAPRSMADTTGVDGAEVAQVWRADQAVRLAWAGQRVDTMTGLMAARCG